MLKIGKTYLHRTDGQVRLCADISLNGKGTTLWFGVNADQEACLCSQRSDAFVAALLTTAMRGGYGIICETPMSERLHYQLENYLIPSMCAESNQYHHIKITAPLTAERLPGKGGVGTGFSGGADCLYTVMTHGGESEYPLTHLAVFNVGAFDGSEYRKNFQNACVDGAAFAKDLGKELVCLDSNISEILKEDFLAVCSFRNLAAALALQGLFSVYLLSSGRAFSGFSVDLSNSGAYDLLIVHCLQTESLAVYCPGGQVHRRQKLEALANWEPAHRWLHPCFRQRLNRGNCGKCKKCIQTMTTLYAQGTLDRFAQVFDVAAFQETLPQNIGYLLTVQDSPFYAEALQCLREHNIPIPPQAYEEAEKLRQRGRNAAHTTTEQRDALRALAQKLRKANREKQTSETESEKGELPC